MVIKGVRMRYIAILLLIWLIPSVSHAALIERLMGLADDGVTPSANLSVHLFFAANQERIGGALSREDVINILGLSGAEITEYDALVALAPTGTAALNVAQKSMYLNKIHAVFILAEMKAPGYSTPAEVRARLGLL